MADAVCASCAVPWLFAPVSIDGRDYVDGAAWSATNLDAAPAGRGTRVLCLDPLAGLRGRDRALSALQRAFRVASAIERQALQRRGAEVVHVRPDDAAASAMGHELMAAGHRREALAAGYRQGLRLAGTGR
jgi:NTE family protein